MKNFILLTESINYIEQNLCEPITRQDIADHCFVSLSSLEKLFGYALFMGIKDYIYKRRITQAAKDIQKTDLSITDISMKYQYNSVEGFSRAFKRVWNVNPSEFKVKWKFNNIFPKINYEYVKGEGLEMARKRVDISEIFEYLRSLSGSYVLCFDGCHFMQFNEVARKLGDIAIATMAQRIDNIATDNMIITRIGGDEFALITGLYDLEKVKALSDEILKSNGDTIAFEGGEYPLSMWCGIAQIPVSFNYKEFFTSVHNSIDESKR